MSRILKDWKAYETSGAELGIICKPFDNNMCQWEAIIIGPDDTEW